MFEKQITAGIELLDKNRPGWEKEINLDTLDFPNHYNCVLGQLYGNVHIGQITLKIAGFIYDYGFNCYYDECKTLTSEWKEAIRKKLIYESTPTTP